jgi:GNAT superfamily N-acetyltransferase
MLPSWGSLPTCDPRVSHEERSGELDVTGELVAQELRAGRPMTVRLWGRSMTPTVWPGARLMFVPCRPDEARLGDVLLVARRSGLCAHRAVRLERDDLETWGDGLLAPDPAQRPEALLGRAIGVPLGRAQLPLPDRLARPLNLGLGAVARSYTATRARLARSPWREPILGVADALRGLRRRLQPFSLVPLDERWRHRLGELELRATRRPSAAASAEWRAALDGPGAAWIAVSERDGEPIGWVLAAPRPDHTWEVRSWVSTGHRRLGVGTALAARMTETASRRGWSRLRARGAAELWRRQGFVEVEATPDGVLELVLEPGAQTEERP